MYFLNANVLAVLVAAVLQWVLGWIWYGMLFKKSWKELVGQDPNAKTANAGSIMTMIFICNLIVSFAIAQVVHLTGWTTLSKGTFVGTVCGLGFVAAPLFVQHISEHRPFKLYGINALYWLFAMLIAGGTLAVWH